MTDEAPNENVENQDVVAPENVEREEVKQEKVASEANSKQYNWRQMEQKNKQLENELYNIKQALENQKKPAKEEVDEFASLQEDDLITYGQVDKLAERKARAIVQQELQRQEKEKLPGLVKSQYKDYDQVVTPENIEQLIKEDPDLEHDISVAKNPYARAYKEIKRSNFFKNKEENKQVDKKIEENSSKPVSSNAIGRQRPLSLANSYAKGSPELYAEMLKYGKNGSL